MLKVNEYFEGKVKSIGLETGNGNATVGVMEKGEYEFNTGSEEIIKIISGRLSVKLPGRSIYKEFGPSRKFSVKGKSKFYVKALVDTAYICYYK